MRVSLTGFKAEDRTLDLSKLNLVTGPNGSGKSSFADGIRFSVLGHIPALGKRPSDTAALMRGDRLEVDVTVAGKTFRRSLYRDGTKLSIDAEASWIGSTKSTEHKEAVLGLFGSDERSVAEVLDIRELLSATPQKRAAIIAELIESSASDPGETFRSVNRFLFQRLSGIAEERIPDDYVKLMEMIAEPQRPILRSLAPMLKAKIAEVGIQGAITWANEEKKTAQASLQGKTKAKKELEARLRELPETSPDEIRKLEEERDRLQRDVGAARERAEETSRRADEIQKVKNSLELGERALAEAEGVMDGLRYLGASVQSKRDRLAQVEGMLDRLEAPEAPDFKAVQELRRDALELRQSAEGVEIQEIPSPVELEGKLTVARGMLAQAEASAWNKVLEFAAWAIPLYSGNKNLIERIRRLEAISRDQLGVDVELLRTDVALCQEDLDAARKKHGDAQVLREEAREERAALERKASAREGRADATAQAIEKRAQAQREEFEAKRAPLLKERDELRKAIDDYDERHRKAKDHVERCQNSQQSYRSKLEGLISPQADEEAPQVSEGDLAPLTSNLSSARSSLAARAELTRLVDAISSAQASRDVYAGLEWALQRQREAEVMQSSGGLLDRMTTFLEAAGRTEQPYIGAAKGHCDIGWMTTDGIGVPIEVLSGGEWQLFSTALAAAVIVARAAPVRILLVEAGEMDGRTLAGLLDGIKAIAAELTAAIVMTQNALSDPAMSLEGWGTHCLVHEEVAA